MLRPLTQPCCSRQLMKGILAMERRPKVLSRRLIQINVRPAKVGHSLLAAPRLLVAPGVFELQIKEVSSMQAKDIMTTNVISVSEDTSVHEIVGLLLKNRISAVPVIDSARKVVGISARGTSFAPRRRAAPERGVRGGWRRSLSASRSTTKRHMAAPLAR